MTPDKAFCGTVNSVKSLGRNRLIMMQENWLTVVCADNKLELLAKGTYLNVMAYGSDYLFLALYKLNIILQRKRTRQLTLFLTHHNENIFFVVWVISPKRQSQKSCEVFIFENLKKKTKNLLESHPTKSLGTNSMRISWEISRDVEPWANLDPESESLF